MQKSYELMVLLHPDLEIDAEAPISKVEGLIEAVGGRVTKRDNWGKKRLAYRIRKQDFAIYVYFEMQLDPSQVSQLDSTILITEEVLRHILVVHEQSAPRKDSKKSEKSEEIADAKSAAKTTDPKEDKPAAAAKPKAEAKSDAKDEEVKVEEGSK